MNKALGVPTNACLIYVYGDRDGSKLKWGKTRVSANARKNIHESRGGEKVEMQWLMGVWGFDADESYLNKYWGTGKKEWMSCDNPRFDECRQWIRFCKQLSFVAHTEDEMSSMSFVDSHEWLPGNGKRVENKQHRFDFSGDAWSDLTTDEIGSGDYYTARKIMDCVHKTMGAIDIDPASCRLANSVVRASRYFGAMQDGLVQEWHGRVWLNPPFNQWDLWADKLLHEIMSDRVKEFCLLAPSRSTCNKNFIPIKQIANCVCLTNGRISFWGPKAGSPDDGNPIFYWGPNTDKFIQAFSKIGTPFRAAV